MTVVEFFTVAVMVGFPFLLCSASCLPGTTSRPGQIAGARVAQMGSRRRAILNREINCPCRVSPVGSPHASSPKRRRIVFASALACPLRQQSDVEGDTHGSHAEHVAEGN